MSIHRFGTTTRLLRACFQRRCSTVQSNRRIGKDEESEEHDLRRILKHASAEILGIANQISLKNATLETLLRFLSWNPFAFILETSIIDMLRHRSFETLQFRKFSLKCLTEIGGLEIGPSYSYDDKPNQARVESEQIREQNTHNSVCHRKLMPEWTGSRLSS